MTGEINRLNDIVNFDNVIFEANLENVDQLSKESLEYSLCRFIPEVTKIKDGSDFPGKNTMKCV